MNKAWLMTGYMGRFKAGQQKQLLSQAPTWLYCLFQNIFMHFNFSVPDLYCMYFVTSCICVAQFSQKDIVEVFDVLQRGPGGNLNHCHLFNIWSMCLTTTHIGWAENVLSKNLQTSHCTLALIFHRMC